MKTAWTVCGICGRAMNPTDVTDRGADAPPLQPCPDWCCGNRDTRIVVVDGDQPPTNTVRD